MMDRLQLLLCKLAEEASEVAQIALKTQQFGLNAKYPGQPFTNAEMIYKELDDLMAILSMLNQRRLFNYKQNAENIAEKIIRVEKYAEYSKSLGEVNMGKQ